MRQSKSKSYICSVPDIHGAGTCFSCWSTVTLGNLAHISEFWMQALDHCNEQGALTRLRSSATCMEGMRGLSLDSDFYCRREGWQKTRVTVS